MYATFVNDVWKITALPIPNIRAKPTTGPTLAIYNNRLYVAWLNAEDAGVSVASASLPLSSNSWSPQVTQIPAKSTVAPTLGLFTPPDSDPAATDARTLYIAWTTSASTLSFERFNSSVGKWTAALSPVPLLPGPLTNFSPAFGTATFEFPNKFTCLYTDIVSFTNLQQRPIDNLGQIGRPCPAAVHCDPNCQ
jgi:hypothetical protein